MRDAATVLGIIRERGSKGQPLEDIYRQLYNPLLFLSAYARLYANAGAMTPGITGETVDGMSLASVEQLIDELRQERFHWTPVKRVYIPKANGKLRPLGIPTWRDKLLQEVVRSILEAYYEPQFHPHSHGFRPNRGCHTALSEVQHTWTGTRWLIEGDIKGAFDNIDHTVLLTILGEKLHDQRFLRLIQHLLQAGYLEEWHYHRTLSGSPQGAIVSPILANIYLDRLDQFVEQTLIPAYTQGDRRQDNHQYMTLAQRASQCRKRGDLTAAAQWSKQAQQLPRYDPHDPHYRRLRYVRYADDILLGFAGPKHEAETIKQQLAEFLQGTLHLELSQEKTLITHASTEAGKFLGYEIVVQQANDQHDHRGRRCINGNIGLRVPARVIHERCARFLQHGQIATRPELLHDDDFSIIARYQAEYRGLVQYYLLAQNVCWFGKLHWVMQGSLLRTLASKHHSTIMQQKRRYHTTVPTAYGPMKCLERRIERDRKPPLVARFGAIPLRHKKHAQVSDVEPSHTWISRNELTKRLLADQCELCGKKGGCEVHHIRKLADLEPKGRREKPLWVRVMAARRRKTLVTCHDCHQAIHSGKNQHPFRRK